jgi:adenylate cyclase
MRFRTKILLLFTLTAVLTNAVSVGMMHELSKRFVLAEHREKVLSIVATVASQVDGDAHRRFQESIGTPKGGEQHQDYQNLLASILRAREANRREDTYIKYLFTVYHKAGERTAVRVGVDPEENVADGAKPGDPYKLLDNQPISFDRANMDREYSTDHRGTWLAAMAPIRDHSGKVVAAVRGEFAVEGIDSRIRPVLVAGTAALLLATVLSLVAAYMLSRNVSRPLQDLGDTLAELGGGNLDARMPVEREARYGPEFAGVARVVNRMADGLKERELVKSAFARYVSHQVMDTVVGAGAPPVVKGESRRITVLFSDILGFSTMSEAQKEKPEAVVEMLNEYFDRMVAVVFRNGGTLDKFLGDGMMVIFGAPAEDPLQEDKAINTAIEMHRELEVLDAKWTSEGKQPLKIGVGVHSGAAIVGNIGSSRRMDYTAVGDTVNLAARLEGATRTLGAKIIVSESTIAGVKGSYPLRDMGTIRVKGRNEETRVYSIDV